MASENPDDNQLNPARDGSKDSGEKKYKGVEKTKYGKFVALCGSGLDRHLGTFETVAEAGCAYDVRARDFHGAQADHNFPDLNTDDNSSPTTESTLPIATPSVGDVQGVPSGTLSANTKDKGEKRKHNIISDLDVDAAGPWEKETRNIRDAKAMHNVPQLLTGDDLFPAVESTLPTATLSVGGVSLRSEFANIAGEQHLAKVLAEVSTTGGRNGSSGSNTKDVAETHAAAEEAILPTATNNTLPIAESSVLGVASMPEYANISSEQEEMNKYTEYINNLMDEDDNPNEEELNEYVENLKNLINSGKGSKSSVCLW